MTDKLNKPTQDNEEKQSNPFSEMKGMLLSSVGRIPAVLVIIFALAVTSSLMVGLALKLMTPQKAEKVFMPLRLEVSASAPQINLKKLQGQWVSQTQNYAMTFSFIGDRFEWIIRFADILDTQFYARGNFRIDGDVLVLGQRPDLGVPYDPSQPWLKFMPMSMSDLNTKISVDGMNLVWEVPASEQSNIISFSSQIFKGNEQGKFIWVKR